MDKVLASVIAFLDALPLLVTGYDDVVAAASALSAQIKVFVTEGRDPTDAEWSDLDAQVKGLLGQLDATGG